MENKKEESKENRFVYSSDEGLKVLSEQEILESINPKKEEKKDLKKSTENEFHPKKYGR